MFDVIDDERIGRSDEDQDRAEDVHDLAEARDGSYDEWRERRRLRYVEQDVVLFAECSEKQRRV